MKKRLLAMAVTLLMVFSINGVAFGAPSTKKPAVPKKKVVVKKKTVVVPKKKTTNVPARHKSLPAKKVTIVPKTTKTEDNSSAGGDSSTTTDNTVKATITSISDIVDNIIVNSAYTLPQTVKAQMSDNTTSDVAVTWDSVLKTDQAGTFTATGKVEGYGNGVKLTLTVNPQPLTITSIDKLTTKEIKQDESYTLPPKISATMSDGSKKDVEIIWDKTLDVSHLGINGFVGTVSGYSKTLNFNVLVRGKDLDKPTEITAEAKVGDIVGTKGSIEAPGFGKISYEHFGIYIGDGNVIEFSSENGTIPSAKITLNPMTKSFKNYFIYKLADKDIKYTPEEIVKRANGEVGKGDYNLIGNNCEHFAVWCQTGVYKSFQIDSYPASMLELVDPLIKTIKNLK